MGLTSPAQAASPEDIDQAIEEGLAWLAAQQDTVTGCWDDSVGATGLAVLKFEIHAIQQGLRPCNPAYEYHDNVVNGLNYLFANAHIIAIGLQIAGDPDTDGDGIGVYFVTLLGNYRNYETSIALMAIAAGGEQNKVVDVPGSEVDGWTYHEVAEDAMNYLAWGQTDTGDGRGGWDYDENDNSGPQSDNSNSGYVVLGLSFAEGPKCDPPQVSGFALDIPEFVKDELSIWIDYIQNDVDDPIQPGDGGSGYAPYDCCPFPTCGPECSVNILKTGNLLHQMQLCGDTPETGRVQDALDYLVRHWDDANQDPGWKGQADPLTPPFTPPASYQAMFTTMRGLELLGIAEINGIDWYDDFSDVIVAQQIPGPPGQVYWSGCKWGSPVLCTAWALLTLEKAVPKPPPPPVAVGGEAFPINKLGVLVPWIGLVILLIGGITWFTLRRRRAGT